MSTIRSFKTAPRVGPDAPFKFIVFGDHGTSSAAQITTKYVTRDIQHKGYELIFHLGDISYSMGMVSILNPRYASLSLYYLFMNTVLFSYPPPQR